MKSSNKAKSYSPNKYYMKILFEKHVCSKDANEGNYWTSQHIKHQTTFVETIEAFIFVHILELLYINSYHVFSISNVFYGKE